MLSTIRFQVNSTRSTPATSTAAITSAVVRASSQARTIVPRSRWLPDANRLTATMANRRPQVRSVVRAAARSFAATIAAVVTGRVAANDDSP